MPTWIRHSMCSVLAMTLGAVLSPGAASAQDFDDPDTIAWKFGYGLSDAGYSRAWEDFKDEGYLPIDIEMDDGGASYSGVWRRTLMDGAGRAGGDSPMISSTRTGTSTRKKDIARSIKTRR